MRRRRTGELALPMFLIMGVMIGCSKAPQNEAAAGNDAGRAPLTEVINEPDSVAPGNAGEEPAGLPTDQWVGRWTGPEGLFLDIQPSPDGKPGHYAITNRDNLDREQGYSGIAEGMTIRFVRDGGDLTIRPGTGAETGFKYLAGKQDCLIVRPGQEGYCR